MIINSLSGLETYFKKMKATFDDLGISLAIDSHLSYGEDMILNIKTVSEYLFELEQFITKYLVYMNSKKQVDQPELVMLDVQLMQPKDFTDKDISIKEFLEKDMIIANDDEFAPMTLEQM